jgi:hypothetical protein
MDAVPSKAYGYFVPGTVGLVVSAIHDLIGLKGKRDMLQSVMKKNTATHHFTICHDQNLPDDDV